MLSLSTPLSAVHLRNYFQAEYSLASNSYFSEDGKAKGYWMGKLASELGLEGAVTEDDFTLLSEGRHPRTGEQLMEHRQPQAPRQPDWVTDDSKWREHLEDLYLSAMEAGYHPFGNAHFGEGLLRDPYQTSDAIHWMIDQLAVVHPDLRLELAREMSQVMGLPEPEAVPEPAPKQREHRAGWDFTFNAPKTVSTTALVGGDKLVREAHRRAVQRTMEYGEFWVQARMGGNAGPQTTGQWIVAAFEHDTARPVNGYPAPHLHTHCIVFNLTVDSNGQARSLQTQEFYRIQEMLTWVYRSELAHELRRLGYELERGTGGAPDIAGYSPEYIAAESPRSQAIRKRLEELGLSGARAAELVAHQERDQKIRLKPEELQVLHQAHAEAFGNEPARVVEAARERRPGQQGEVQPGDAAPAVTFSRRHLSEREAVFEHHKLVANALRYGWGEYRVGDVEREIGRRVERGEIVKVLHIRPYAPGARYATTRMLQMEREIIQAATAGRSTVEPILENANFSAYPVLANHQRRQEVLRGILGTRDQTVILQGSAGVGKTTSLRILSEMSQERGYEVVGLAPTGKAADTLREIGVRADTLPMFLTKREAQPEENRDVPPRFYFVDEGSLASTRQMHQFYGRLQAKDRVLLIGDDSPQRTVGQHTSVEAGRIFQELQEAGIKTAQLNKILRQKEPWLLEVVEHLRDGRTKEAVASLDQRGRVEEYRTRQLRYARIARVYAQQPERTLVVSPDHASRREINDAIRHALKQQGLIRDEKAVQVLVARDLTRADRTLAVNYQVFDSLRYFSGSAQHGIRAKDYATVIDVDRTRNRLTVLTADRRKITYDPRQTLANCSVYEERQLSLGVGDRVQCTAPFKEKGLRTRETGVVQEFDGRQIVVQFDHGKTARWNWQRFRHLDFGYVMTSHASQSMTVDRCLVHVETGDSHLRALHNRTFAYVAGSRPEFDLQVFTDHTAELLQALSRPQEKHKALSPEQIQELAKTA